MGRETPTSAETRHARELRLLQEISETVDRTIDLRTVVEPILEALSANLGFERSLITVLSRDRESIWIDASRGLTAEQAAHGRYRLGEGVVGRVVESGEALIVPDTSLSPVFLNRTGSGREPGMAFICVPIKEKEETLGALAVYRRSASAGELSEDAGLLKIVASMLARAILLRRDLQAERDSLVEENRRLRSELSRSFHPSNMVGGSPEMLAVYEAIEKVAPSQATVLVLGETGTGKELVARAIHASSPRAAGPFVAVHCGALPESLVESELFGHVKGAFTGALADHKGRFALASGGTIFFDEVGEIPMPVQAKLLRAIQERTIVPVGGEKPVKVDVRIVAATHRDLAKMVEEGSFREDLYYRLAVFPIRLPPLAARRQDILPLAQRFLERFAKNEGRPAPRIGAEAAAVLSEYGWPGNVRELENCMERALLLAPGDTITTDALPGCMLRGERAAPASAAIAAASSPAGATDFPAAVAAFEKSLIEAALGEAGWNVAEAARRLSASYRVISYKAAKYGLLKKNMAGKA